MMLRLQSPHRQQEGIPATEMKDGQVAMVLNWSDYPLMEGAIVMRIGIHLVQLVSGNKEAAHVMHWTNYFEVDSSDRADLNKVKLLPNGTQFIVYDNDLGEP